MEVSSTQGELLLIITDVLTEFQRMAGAIEKLSRRTGRSPILFSLCQWGEVSPTSSSCIMISAQS